MVSSFWCLIMEDFITVLALKLNWFFLVDFCNVNNKPEFGGVILTALVTEVASLMTSFLVILEFSDVKICLWASRLVTFECSFRICSMDSHHMLLKTVSEFFATNVAKWIHWAHMRTYNFDGGKNNCAMCGKIVTMDDDGPNGPGHVPPHIGLASLTRYVWFVFFCSSKAAGI